MAPQKRLTIEEKSKILKKLDSGVRANRLALDFGVSESANKEKQRCNKCCCVKFLSRSEEKTLHKAEYEELESKLYEWFLKQRGKNPE